MPLFSCTSCMVPAGSIPPTLHHNPDVSLYLAPDASLRPRPPLTPRKYTAPTHLSPASGWPPAAAKKWQHLPTCTWTLPPPTTATITTHTHSSLLETPLQRPHSLKPNRRLASCCSEEVVKGGGGLRATSRRVTPPTLQSALRTRCAAAAAAAASGKPGLGGGAPSMEVSRACVCGGGGGGSGGLG